MPSRVARWVLVAAVAGACAGREAHVLTFAGSAVGKEAEALRLQLERFRAAHPELRVALRPTPDAADHRHQLYVQWLNARASDPDVLQLDVVWTPEFAAAGWILALDRFHPRLDEFFPAAVDANRWRGNLYALPWFVDVGMLYRRTDLAPDPPTDLDALVRLAGRAMDAREVPFGFVWGGARYEGLVTVFLEHLGGFGGRILDEHGRVVVDSEAAVRALTYMRDAIYANHTVPPAVLTWQEEQVRFAFQNGQAAFMRNWPYAYGLLQEPEQSRVVGHVAVSAMPAAPGGMPTAALGGSQLAINARSGEPEAAFQLVEYLLAPTQLLERARLVGEFPPRPDMYDTAELAEALGLPLSDVRHVIARAVPRPVTPVYTQLSEILQVSLHRALTRQQEPEQALREAARTMQALFVRTGLGPTPP